MKNAARILHCIIILALVICSCVPAFSADDDEGKYIVLDVEGEGKDRNEAVESAWLTGIRQAVGSFIDSKTELNNEQLTERIISYSRGLVEKYEVLSVDDSRADKGLYKVKVRMWIVQAKLTDGAQHASSKSAEISFSPGDLKRQREELDAKAARELEAKNAAEQTAKQKSQTGADLLEAMLNRYKPEDFLSCYFPGKPEPVKDRQDVYTVRVELSFNDKLYKESFIPDLIQVFDQIAGSRKNTMLVKYKNELRNLASKKALTGVSDSIIAKVFETEKNYDLAVYNRPERFGVRLYGFRQEDSANIKEALSDFMARTSRVKGITIELLDEDKEVIETITHSFPINFLITNSRLKYIVHPTMIQQIKKQEIEKTPVNPPRPRMLGMPAGVQSFAPTGTVPENVAFRIVFRNPVVNRDQLDSIITPENNLFPFEINPPLQLEGGWQNDRTFTAKLLAPLRSATIYTATLKDGLKDRRGGRIGPGAFTFKTEGGTTNSFESMTFIAPITLEMPEEVIPFVKNIKASLLIE